MTDRHAVLLALAVLIVGAAVLDLWRWLVALCLVAALGLVLRALAGRTGWAREHHTASPRAPAPPAAWRAPQGLLDPDALAVTPPPASIAPVVVQVGPVTILVPQSAEASTLPVVQLPAPSPAPGLPAPKGAAWAAEPAALPEPKEVR